MADTLFKKALLKINTDSASSATDNFWAGWGGAKCQNDNDVSTFIFSFAFEAFLKTRRVLLNIKAYLRIKLQIKNCGEP